MSFDTYANLQTEIKGWLKRSTMTDTTVEGFISLAEIEMNRKLRTRNQEVRETFTVDSEYTDLTTLTNTVLELRSIQLNTDPVRSLEYRSPSQLGDAYSDTGKPCFYSIIGDELQVNPSPDSSYTAEAAFYSPIAVLSDSNTSNWVLTNHPDIYLYGALYFGNLFIKDETAAQINKTLFDNSIKQLNKQERLARYSGSALAAKTKTATP